ncbi:MAG: flagellar hook assembly protein FlgD [bacterium]|nr:flagellar hook assembly protein FlgD [bacterium]
MSLDATRSTLANAQSVLRDEAIKSGKGNSELGKDDFMNLFMTQMSNQDPTSPMDSAGMTAQLAQLGAMEQLEKLNKGMEALNKTQSGMANHQALSFIGRDVMLDANEVALTQGSGQPVYYNLDQEMTGLKVSIEAKDGSPVYSEDLGLSSAGKHRYVWDGKNDRGTLMGDGLYKIRLIARHADGTSEEVAAYNSGRVNQVEFQGGEAFVNAQGRKLPVSQIRSVDNSSQQVFGNAKPLPLMRELRPQGLIKDPKEIVE